MTAALVHRGPDDGGVAQIASSAGALRGALGNRRLAILDLSPAGHQPMRSPDSRFCLTFNGEIYNFREIRTELTRLGAQFSSSGDTAVILEGWKRWGSGLLPRLRGMFALALWDRDEERCYLARDAFGIKPLYLHDSGGTVLFASEVRALLASGRIARRIDSAALRSYLATGSVAEPRTIIDSIVAVPAGTCLSIDCRRGSNIVGEPVRFADALPVDTGHEGEFGPEQLRSVLRDSVEHHLVSDVPVALFLSGGIDSSTVVAVASEVSPSRLDSFTITFGEKDYSEAEPARVVAKKFGTSHHEIPLSAKDLLDSLPGAFAAMDQPSLDGLNTFAVSRAVRENGIKVVLSGLGGDELFAGYPSFRRAATASRLWPLRAPARAMVGRAAGVFRDSRLQRLKILFDAATPARGAYRASRTLFDDQRTRSLTGNPRGEIPPAVSDSPEEMMLSLLQQLSLFETTGYMRNTLLRDSDVFSMAHSLELRVPFVDREVARAAMKIPDSAKLRRGVSKPVLVDAMKDILPESLLARPKQGFTLPFEKWMRDELFPEISSVLKSPSVGSVGLAPREVAAVWNAFLDRRDGMTWSRPWALYTLKRWADQNEVAIEERPATPEPSASLAGAR
jgi:asparagine synthase (glutamine-hydrolysing)